MHDSPDMRFRQPFGSLSGEVEYLFRLKRTLAKKPAKRLPLYELHRDVVNPVVLANVVDRNDVGVVESGRGTRLLLEASRALRIQSELLPEHLDRHVAPELQVFGPVHISSSR